MNHHPTDRIKRAGIVLMALLPALAAGCSSGNPATGADKTNTADAATGQFRTVDQIKQAGSVKIGVFSDKAPFGYVDADGAYAGYDVVYAERIAKDLGVEVEFVPVEAASRVAFLESGKVDIILANFTVTAERAQKVDFAKPYMKVSLGVASPDGAVITQAQQLDGKNAIVVKGTTAETYLEANQPNVKLTKFDQYTEATSALLDGRGDAWVTDNTEALAWTEENPGFTTGIATLGPADTIAGAVTKGNTSLLQWLDDELVTLGGEQFFHDAYAKTLKPVYGSAVSADELVVEGGKA